MAGQFDSQQNDNDWYKAYYKRIRSINPVTNRANHLFVCKLCTKIKTSRHSDIQDHIRNHLKVKPFKCETCGLAFSKKSNLNRHMESNNCVR